MDQEKAGEGEEGGRAGGAAARSFARDIGNSPASLLSEEEWLRSAARSLSPDPRGLLILLLFAYALVLQGIPRRRRLVPMV
ncbi:fd7f22a9-8005-4e1a-92ce-ae6c4dac9535 [Thermothielavioides terrestris]|uniref:Fd7f22a9-8005-4e1a-92ce-ae6c4dac9535 n=1 Tax=Thermothielavioides terrestris TaxID=2587410 RepID=A0A446BA73_9PEZI|nr:fd7f22a9-8005-4e1a-92ce-ae6c4dac9535 [Thermothielavioides terrestris]